MTKKNYTPKRSKIIEIDEGQVRAHVAEMIRDCFSRKSLKKLSS